MPRAASPTPRRSKQWKALGPSWIPAPISPSWLAFSRTSEGMPFCARASAVASPPMPPPAMRILSWTTDYLVVVKLADLAIAEPQDTRQDFVRMLAQRRRDARPLALEGTELERRGSHRIAPVAEARPVDVVDHGLADVTQRRGGGQRHVLQRQYDHLPLPRQPPMSLGGDDCQRAGIGRGEIPRRRHGVHWPIVVDRTGDHGKAGDGVHRVVD